MDAATLLWSVWVITLPGSPWQITEHLTLRTRQRLFLCAADSYSRASRCQAERGMPKGMFPSELQVGIQQLCRKAGQCKRSTERKDQKIPASARVEKRATLKRPGKTSGGR